MIGNEAFTDKTLFAHRYRRIEEAITGKPFGE